MKIKTQDLTAAVNQVSPICTGRTTLPILTHMRVSAKDGQLEISGTNLDCYETAKAPCEGDIDPVCIPAGHFTHLCNSGNGEVSLEIVKDRAIIKSGWNAELPTLPAVEFPPFPDSKVKAIGVPVVDLADGIDGVEWAQADPKLSRWVLEHVFIECKPKVMEVTATNGKKFAFFSRPLICASFSCLLPGVYAKQFAAALRKPGAIFSASENWAAVNYDSGSFCVKLAEGEKYPNAKPILGEEVKLLGDINREALLFHLSHIDHLSRDEMFARARFMFDDKGLEIACGENKLRNAYSGTIEGKFPLANFECDARILMEGLKKAGQDIIALSYAEAKTSFTDGDFRYITALLSMKQ